MEAMTFQYNGKTTTVTSKEDAKRLRACGWKKVKKPTLIDIHGRKIG